MSVRTASIRIGAHRDKNRTRKRHKKDIWRFLARPPPLSSPKTRGREETEAANGQSKKNARRAGHVSGFVARLSMRRGIGGRYLILCSTGIRYLLKVTGFSDIGKCPMSSMMMHSALRTFFAVFCVISGVQAKS
jgi:hypothetical protein